MDLSDSDDGLDDFFSTGAREVDELPHRQLSKRKAMLPLKLRDEGFDSPKKTYNYNSSKKKCMSQWITTSLGEEQRDGYEPEEGSTSIIIPQNSGFVDGTEKTSQNALLDIENSLPPKKVPKLNHLILGTQLSDCPADQLKIIMKTPEDITTESIINTLQKAVQKTKNTPECVMWKSQLGIAATLLARDEKREAEHQKALRALQNSQVQISQLLNRKEPTSRLKDFPNPTSHFNPMYYDGGDILVKSLSAEDEGNGLINIPAFYAGFGPATDTLKSLVIQATIRWTDKVMREEQKQLYSVAFKPSKKHKFPDEHITKVASYLACVIYVPETGENQPLTYDNLIFLIPELMRCELASIFKNATTTEKKASGKNAEAVENRKNSEKD